MLILALAVLLAATYMLVLFCDLLLRNRRAHKLFERESPQLPVVPAPNFIAGHALQIVAPDKNWKIIEDLHKKYGPTFGYYMIDHPWISTKDPDLIKLIEIDEPHKHINRAFLNIPFSEFNNSIWHIENDHWRQMRRLVASGLSNRKVRGPDMAADIESTADQLLGSLERRARKALQASGGKSSSFVVDARDLADRYIFSIIFLVVYQLPDMIDFDCEKEPWVVRANKGAREIAGPLVYVAMAVPALKDLCELLNRFSESGRLQRQIKGFIKRLTRMHMEAREQHKRMQQQAPLKPDGTSRGMGVNFSQVKSLGNFKRRFVDTIVDSFFERKIKYDDVEGTVLFLLLAGLFTTSDTINCLLWQLAKNPNVQDKLRKTILEEGIDADYVIWCINETVRYHPAVPLGTGRVLGQDVVFKGMRLPKGAHIMPTTHGIHHDPSIWPEPERFWPERWAHAASFHPAQFVGFGLGPRNCAGSKLAAFEIKLMLRDILTNYRVGVCAQTPKEWHFSSPGMFFTINDQPVKVEFTSLREARANGA